jgi:O-antigen chain-terminating methyltransferase
LSDSDDRNIRAILNDLQEEIRHHRAALGLAGAAPRPDPLARVREYQAVNPHLPIGWPTMPAGLLPKLAAYAQKIVRRLLRWYINPIVAQQNQFNAAAAELLALIQARAEELERRTADLETRLTDVTGDHASRLAQMQQTSEAELAQLRQKYDAWFESVQAAASHEREVVSLRLGRLERWRQAALPTPETERSPVDAFLLAARYRNEAQMQARLGDYDDLFTPLAGAQAGPLLDLGCGRGQFVAHLTELGLTAYGIDNDPDAVAAGRELGRDVRCEDAFAHLAALPADSLAAVSMIQVAEHFTVPDLARLFSLCARVLAPGGFLLMETINPACLHALANWYLIDPTHRIPLHPELARFLLEGAGLWRVQVRFLHPVPPADQPAGATPEVAALLYGPQDYAAIAFKPQE